MTSIFQPITWFTDKAGNPLDNGEIYLGTSGLDARTNPIAAYRDSALTIPWVQPIPTVSGYPAYQGAPARIYISPSSCSMTVLQNDGQVVFNNIEAAGILDSAAGAAYVAKAGDTMTGKLVTVTPDATTASFNLPHGIAPSSPINGDLWSTTAGIYARVNSATVQIITSTGAETLTNKTLTAPAITTPSLTGTPIEDVFTITDGAAFEIDPANGSIQTITLGANRTPKGTNFQNGQSILMAIDDGTAYTITWTDSTFGASGVKWIGGTAPTLATSGLSWLTLFKVAGQVYGAYQGATT
jgi:hypothetical protein